MGFVKSTKSCSNSNMILSLLFCKKAVSKYMVFNSLCIRNVKSKIHSTSFISAFFSDFETLVFENKDTIEYTTEVYILDPKILDKSKPVFLSWLLFKFSFNCKNSG